MTPPPSNPDADWRQAARDRSERSKRRRANAIMLLVAVATILAATAAFAIPMVFIR